MSTSVEKHLETFVSVEPDTLHKAGYTYWRLDTDYKLVGLYCIHKV